MRKRSIATLAAAVVLVYAAVAAISAINVPDTPSGYYHSASGALVIDPDHRPPAPALHGATIDGKPLALADLKGKTVILNAWASWCAPCRKETPLLSDYHRQHATVTVLGIDQNDSTADGRAFTDAYKVPYPSLHDPGGRAQLDFPKGIIRSRGLPFTVIIDPQGRIAASYSGELDRQVLDAMVKWATHPNPTPPSTKASR
ncbi:TlpA disulfide reductase family protein [Streptomyces sp. NPDC047869]|uniref:TlpA family protein disulfide reductase n=1 Tax=Streptomyces sp. NPDC047869 TaxID=3154709 RepID=UPI003451492A